MVEVQRRQSQPSHSFNQQTFVEVPGTVLRAEDTPTGQENRQYSAWCRGSYTKRIQKTHYRVVTCAMKTKQGEEDCCLRWR